MRISHGEIGMTWFEFMQLTGEQVVELCKRSAVSRPERPTQPGTKMMRYTRVSDRKVIKAVPVAS